MFNIPSFPSAYLWAWQRLCLPQWGNTHAEQPRGDIVNVSQAMADAQTGKTDWEQPAVTALGGRWVVSSFFFLVVLCFLISPEGTCVALIITTKANKRRFSKIQITGYMLPGNRLRRTANLQLMVTKVQNVTADWVLVSSVPVWTLGLIFVPACLLPCAVAADHTDLLSHGPTRCPHKASLLMLNKWSLLFPEFGLISREN